MIPIGQKEAFEIRKQFPFSPVQRLMIHDSKRHHYLATPDRCVLEYLSKEWKMPISEINKL